MSCLDVMYHHQSYGALHYLPATTAAAAAAYRAAYQQQVCGNRGSNDIYFKIRFTSTFCGQRNPLNLQTCHLNSLHITGLNYFECLVLDCVIA